MNYLLFLFVFLLGALRNTHTGIDTRNYCLWFLNTDYNLTDLWNNTIKGIDTEQFFYILNYFLKFFITDPSVYLAVLLLIFLIPFAVLIYKESECEPISYIFYVGILINSFIWQGLRQAIAMGICICSFFFLKEKKWFHFGLLVLLAFMFHRSAFIFILAVLGLYFKPNWFYLLTLIIIFFIAYIIPSSFNNIVLNVFIGDSEFSQKMIGYGNSGLSGSSFKLFVVLLIFYILGFIHKHELAKKNKLNSFFINMAFFACCFQAMAVSIAEFFRVAYYFSIFNAILVANICQLYQEKYPKYHLRLILICLMIGVFFIAGGFDYWFIWEDKSW